jgi:hypothetical protein
MRRLSSLAFAFTDEFEKRNNDEKYFSLRGLDPSLVGPIVRKAPAAGLVFRRAKNPACVQPGQRLSELQRKNRALTRHGP